MFKKPLLPGIIWSIFIALLTLLPGNYIPDIITLIDWLKPDKLVHLALFSVFAILFIEGFRRQSSSRILQYKAVQTSLLLGMVFAIFTEVMQKHMIPGRNGNHYDFLADCIGLVLGYMIWRIIRRNGNKKLSTSKNYN
ncbi:MAG TPA: VanZ family protein [Bacteroidales bacterium]|nr:VanZ family protein [Bacteroidales bacterium]